MDTDIRDELDRSFGDGPAHPPVAEQITLGQRALRRRRGAAALAACAAVVAIGASYAAATSGTSSSDTGTHIATDPTTAPAPTAAEPAWDGATAARYLDGELQVRDGVVVHEQLDNPFGYDAPDLSDALDVTFRGERLWLLLDRKDGRESYLASEPSNGWASFADWVADQTGTAVPGDDGWPETVRLDDRGKVVAAEGATIVQRTDDPQLGDSFAPAGATTGAAVVTVAGEKPSYFVVWRVIDGELDVITTPPRDVVGATFDELIAYAQSQYASGEGLR